MRFADDLYALYKDQLSGDENETIFLVLNVLSEQNRDDLMKLVDELSENELRQMLSLYLVELLKSRLVRDGIMQLGRNSENSPYH